YLYEEPTQIIEYGTQPTKKSMEDVIHFFMKNYNFTNFDEWTSLLKIYNIKSTLLPANENRAKPGLLYSILDMTNNKSIGVPILTGELNGKPTYNTLNKLYKSNRLHQESLSIRVPLELTFLKAKDIETESELIDQLISRGINPVLLEDPTDQSEIVIYIDHLKKCAVDSRKISAEFQFKNLVVQSENSLEINQTKLQRSLKPRLH